MAVQPTQTPSNRNDTPQKARRAARERMRFAGSSPVGERRSARSFAAAIGLHIVAIAVLVRLVTLGHGLYDWLGLSHDAEKPEERVSFVETKAIPKPPTPKAKVVDKAVQPTQSVPAATVAPLVAPEPIVAPGAPAAGVRSIDSASAGGGGSTTGRTIDPNLRGIIPGTGDPRIWGEPRAVVGVPRDRAENADSLVGTIFRAAKDSLDSLMRVNASPGTPDWTKRDKDGNKWGWDNAGIRLGKVVIPNALLGLLPLNAQAALSSNPTSASNDRRLAYARAEILRMSERSIGEAEFRKSIKELRERREREHQAQQTKPQDTKAAPPKADNE